MHGARRSDHRSKQQEGSTSDKEDVDSLDEELLHVAETLCGLAAAFLLVGQVDKAACHLEQASDLLEERARVAMRPRVQLAEQL